MHEEAQQVLVHEEVPEEVRILPRHQHKPRRGNEREKAEAPEPPVAREDRPAPVDSTVQEDRQAELDERDRSLDDHPEPEECEDGERPVAVDRLHERRVREQGPRDTGDEKAVRHAKADERRVSGRCRRHRDREERRVPVAVRQDQHHAKEKNEQEPRRQ